MIAAIVSLVAAAGVAVLALVLRTPSTAPAETQTPASAQPAAVTLAPVSVPAQSVMVVPDALPSSKPAVPAPPTFAAHTPARPAIAYPQRPERPAPPPSPVPAAPAPSASAAVDCNPPFYFVGKKKVYKDGCL